MRSRTSRLAWLGAACMALGVAPSGVDAVANIGLLEAPLPFSVQTHPVQLPSTLFAASLPLVNTSVSYEPTDDTQTTLGDIPFPTGAWWTNLVLDKGASPVSTMPYSVKVNNGKLHVAYPFRVVLPTVIQNGFLSEMVLSAASKGPWQQQVVGFDAFGVGLQFTSPDETAGQFTVHLVRGSPYITTEYKDSVPMIEAMDGIKIQRIKRIDDTMTDMNGQPLAFPVYALQLSSNHLWYVFGSDDTLNLSLSDGIVVANEKFTGVMRVALAVTVDELPYLIESAPVFPVGGQVKYDVDTAKEVATIEFAWKTRTFPGHADKSDELLMVALPHHNDTLVEGTKVIDDLRYTAIRGIMVGVIGNSWKMEEALPPVEWNYGDNKGLFDTAKPDAAKRSEMGKKALEEIVASLKKDIQTYLTLAPDSYGFGKQIGREARLLIIADALKQQKEFEFELEKIKREMLPWLSAKNGDALIYDERFGGLITTDGFHDQNADFGNGYYNDHHFHYGYFMHALAVLRKYAPEVIEDHATAAAMIAADIGTPLDSTQTKFFGNFPARHYFPTARHKDWFVGHSYASGIFPMEVGKSQESSSECINAYYGLALFGSLDEDALEDPLSYYNYARLLLATEISSTKKYWHMRENSQVYEPIFAKNAMVGVVGEMSVVYSTWFGDRPEYVHGINMIPFTPITAELMNEAYVAREYDQLRYSYDGIESTDIWKSIVVLDHAILDAEAAWEELTNEVAAYDTWNSKTNSLLWIATRPSWFDEKNRTKLTKPNLHDEDKCFGFPACSTAGANGTALACCASLPGCCPSALGCCPKKDPAELPVNACFGEHKCAVLGLGCCNSIDGCCTPNPVTGEVLGCCKDPTPRSVTPAPSSTKLKTTPAGFCNRQPKCSALGLLCCDSGEGCCKPDPVTGAQLDCCVPEDEDDVATCHSQPRCGAAGLDCCATANGCCTPDPITGATLDCCDAATPPPTVAAPTDDGTCHNEPQCAKAGLDCCLNPEGCCKPDPVTGAKLLCCQGDAPAEVSTTSTGTGTSSSDDDSGSTATRVIAIGLGVVFVVIVAYCLATCYRRRHYAPIEHDTRAWSCAALMLIVAALFVYLVAMA